MTNIYFVALRTEDGGIHFAPIPDAEPVVIKGWEHLDLCVHKTLSMMNGKVRQTEDEDYTITEGSTGYAIAWADTSAYAIGNCERALLRVGQAKVDATIAKIRQESPSPRYQERQVAV